MRIGSKGRQLGEKLRFSLDRVANSLPSLACAAKAPAALCKDFFIHSCYKPGRGWGRLAGCPKYIFKEKTFAEWPELNFFFQFRVFVVTSPWTGSWIRAFHFRIRTEVEAALIRYFVRNSIRVLKAGRAESLIFSSVPEPWYNLDPLLIDF